MNEQQQGRRLPTGVLAGLAALVLVAGGGTAWLARNSQTISEVPVTTPTVIPTTTPTVEPTETPTLPVQPTPATTATQPTQPAAQPTAQIFWLRDTGTSTELVPVPIAQNKADKPDANLQVAFNNLLAGPTDTANSSAIPQGTKMRSLAVKNGGVYLDLSRDFKTGGGSSSMIARLAQVLYTATSLEPNAKVWISVEGEPLELLGGEGLEVPQPLTRDIFRKDYSL